MASDDGSAYQGPDPHGVVPDEFAHESLQAARHAIEPNPREQPRCPASHHGRLCNSTDIVPLSDKACARSTSAYKCEQCGHYFDEPRRSRRERALSLFEQARERRQQRRERPSLPEDTEKVGLGEVVR